MSEIEIKVSIDGVEFTQDQLKDLAKNSKQAAEGLEATKEGVEKTEKATKKASKEAGLFSEKTGFIADTFNKLKTDAKSVAQGFVSFSKGLGLSAKASKGLAVGLSALGIPLILAGIAALIEFFKNFEAAARLVQTALNVLGAVAQGLVDVFKNLFTLNFSGLVDSIKGIAEEAGEAARQTGRLFDSQKALNDLQKENVIVNAELRQEIERQKKILEDNTLTLDERLEALDKVNESTEKLQQNEIAETKALLENLDAQLQLENNYEKRRELELQIAETQANLIDKETQLNTIRQDAAKAERELIQTQRDERQAALEAQLKIQEDFNSRLLSLQQENELAQIESTQERAKRRLEIERENAIAELENTEFTAEQKRELELSINKKYDLLEEARREEVLVKEREEAQKKLEQEQQAREKINQILQQAGLESIEDTFERAQEELRIQEEAALAELDLLGATEAEKEKIANKFSKKREKLAEEEANTKIELEKKVRDANLDIATQALGTVAALIGENTAAGKAAAIAATVIDTYVGAQKAFTSQLIPGDPTAPIRGAIAAGAAIATGIANVAAIARTPTPGASTSAAGASISQPAARQFSGNTGSLNIAEQTGGFAQSGAINDLELNLEEGGTSPVFKTYVVATDVTSAQEANKKVEDLAKL